MLVHFLACEEQALISKTETHTVVIRLLLLPLHNVAGTLCHLYFVMLRHGSCIIMIGFLEPTIGLSQMSHTASIEYCVSMYREPRDLHHKHSWRQATKTTDWNIKVWIWLIKSHDILTAMWRLYKDKRMLTTIYKSFSSFFMYLIVSYWGNVQVDINASRDDSMTHVWSLKNL